MVKCPICLRHQLALKHKFCKGGFRDMIQHNLAHHKKHKHSEEKQ